MKVLEAGEGLGENIIDLLDQLRTARNYRRQRLTLSELELAEHQHLLKVIVQFGGDTLSFTLLRHTHFRRQRPKAFL